MKRVRPVSTLLLVGVWVTLMGQLGTMNLVYGLLLALLVQAAFPMPSLARRIRLHPWPALVLLGHFALDLFVASWRVAWLAIRPGRSVGRGSLVDVPLRLHDDLRRTVVATFTSLVPGTVVIDVDPDSSVMGLHVLDVTDEQALLDEVRKVRRLEERVAAAIEVSPLTGRENEAQPGGPSTSGGGDQ